MNSGNIDPNQWAKMIVDISTGQMTASNESNAEKLTSKERSEIAKKAAKVRWEEKPSS
jgi:hypothetical protein